MALNKQKLWMRHNMLPIHTYMCIVGTDMCVGQGNAKDN